jgi:hypothetical protein
MPARSSLARVVSRPGGRVEPPGAADTRSTPPKGSPLTPARGRASFRSPSRLQWRGDGYHLDGKGAAVVRIVPDRKYPGVMWRVELPDGRLSDMANKTRAQDAAISLAMRALNNAVQEAAE